jgi:Zn-dependent peptidase ImmA (M78 family)/transcriptional regulator with XRE-family HTH domain
MSERIPVNPEVLRWARETGGFDIEEVAAKINRKRVTSETVKSWEDGTASPTYAQLEQLAYTIYKRPLALFFFPEPPEEESPKQSFRTLPEFEISRMEPRLHYLIRQARVMHINLAELNDGVNPAKHQIVQDLRFKPDAVVDTMATKVRKYLGVTLATQKTWKNPDVAFKAWRKTLEDNGVFVFKETFNQRVGRERIDSRFSGFCLYDEKFPIIYVNNSKSHTRQIFTLFHELSHLLLGTGGVDTRLDDYIHLLRGNERKIETLCNRFGGCFLVPDNDFDRRIAGISINERSIESLAKRYNVSREVILRKFFDRDLIDESYYERQVKQWAREAPLRSGSGGNYYLTKGVYLGEQYIDLAFSRYLQKRISVDQLANYLGVKLKNVAGMELQLFKRGEGV